MTMLTLLSEDGHEIFIKNMIVSQVFRSCNIYHIEIILIFLYCEIIEIFMSQFWNERYQDNSYVYGEEPNLYLKKYIDHKPPKRILFVCEGEGRNAVYAATKGWKVEAFDSSIEGKRKAEKLAQKNNSSINYQVADASVIEYPNATFDIIAIIYTHLPEEIRKQLHKRCIQWLVPKGEIILEAFEPKQLNNTSGGPKDKNQLYTIELLQKDFESLEIHHLAYHETELHEGPFHNGKANIIRMIASKSR